MRYNTLTEDVYEQLVDKLKQHGYVNETKNKDYTRYYIGQGDSVFIYHDLRIIHSTQNTVGSDVVADFFGAPHGKCIKSKPNEEDLNQWKFIGGGRGSGNTFIITYNPAKWDEALIQELIDQLNDGEKVIERWKFGSHKMCKVGDRIFLSRTGAIKSGLIGSGHIASPPRQEPNFEKPDKLSWYVDVQFDYLAPTPDTVVINHEKLSNLLDVPKRSFTPQQSGISFKGDSEFLEDIWQSLTGTDSFQYAQEIVDNGKQKFSEGVKQRIIVNRYERDPKARRACIEIHGYSCQVCSFDFETVYGELGKEYIHVHHLVPLKEIGEKYNVDPEKDLIPVCPNCHAMLHRSDDSGDLDKLKNVMTKERGQ